MTSKIDSIRDALAGVIDPNTQKRINATDKTCDIQQEGSDVTVTLTLGYPLHNGQSALQERIETALSPLGVTLKALNIKSKIVSHAVQKNLRPMPTVRNIIAVSSGKGGVGKSTTSVNLALALRDLGAKVGLLDADIYGPSVPIMLGLSGKPDSLDGKSMEPLVGHGIQANSIGFLLDDDAPTIRRGPMVTQALTQLLEQTNWKDLDYLI